MNKYPQNRKRKGKQMNISGVEPLSFNTVCKVLGATHISAMEKEQFIMRNRLEIHKIMEGRISGSEFKGMMKNRPLKIFRPFKNSFTKAGDKKLLAQTLDIEPSEVDDYISEISEDIRNGTVDDIPKDQLEAIKSYVYRHGKKDEVAEFLNYELSTAGDILGVLYRTLSYNTGGAADYYVRPIHRMNNSTLVNLYNIVDKNLKDARRAGNISETEHERNAEWALVRIYEIQNNQKLKNAAHLKKELGM